MKRKEVACKPGKKYDDDIRTGDVDIDHVGRDQFEVWIYGSDRSDPARFDFNDGAKALAFAINHGSKNGKIIYRIRPGWYRIMIPSKKSSIFIGKPLIKREKGHPVKKRILDWLSYYSIPCRAEKWTIYGLVIRLLSSKKIIDLENSDITIMIGKKILEITGNNRTLNIPYDDIEFIKIEGEIVYGERS